MIILDREKIAAVIDLSAALASVEQSFVLYSRRQVTMPDVAHLGFADPPGDCHIKAAHLHGQPVFAVKVSNGFYENPARGLPSSNGLVAVFSAMTGAPLALLQDEGLITDVRTGLAGVVVTSIACTAGFGTVGIVGAGIQARLQLEYLHTLKGPLTARVWGRSARAVEQYVSDMRQLGIPIEASESIEDLCATCRTIITTTPSTEALIENRWVQPGTHITAVGADAAGKQELDPGLFARARGVLVDSREQCIDHAEVCHAVKRGLLSASDLTEIGEVVDGAGWQFNPDGDITVADLSGLGASDAMMAQSILAASGVPLDS